MTSDGSDGGSSTSEGVDPEAQDMSNQVADAQKNLTGNVGKVNAGANVPAILQLEGLSELEAHLQMRDASPSQIPPSKLFRDQFIRSLSEDRKYRECADLVAKFSEAEKIFLDYPFERSIPWASWNWRGVWPVMEKNFDHWMDLITQIFSAKPDPSANARGAVEQSLVSIGMVWRHIDAVQFVSSPSQESAAGSSLPYTQMTFSDVVEWLQGAVTMLTGLVKRSMSQTPTRASKTDLSLNACNIHIIEHRHYCRKS